MKVPESDCTERDTEPTPEIPSDMSTSTATTAPSEDFGGLTIRDSKGILLLVGLSFSTTNKFFWKKMTDWIYLLKKTETAQPSCMSEDDERKWQIEQSREVRKTKIQ